MLHTWGRDPTVYHPHVHFVVPGGGVSEDGSAWQATPENFLFHHATLIRVYKAKLADHLRACGLYDAVPAEAWRAKFVVDIKPVGDGQAVLKYLAPYVNRVAISDNRIVACDDSSVTFRYTPSGTKQSKTRTVSGTEFVRGFAQHTLPSRFQKIRYYGWMSPNSKVKVDEVKWLVWLFLGWTFYLASGRVVQESPRPRPTVRCAECGGTMRIVEVSFEAAACVTPSCTRLSRQRIDAMKIPTCRTIETSPGRRSPNVRAHLTNSAKTRPRPNPSVSENRLRDGNKQLPHPIASRPRPATSRTSPR